jgi:hypothetical protein
MNDFVIIKFLHDFVSYLDINSTKDIKCKEVGLFLYLSINDLQCTFAEVVGNFYNMFFGSSTNVLSCSLHVFTN